MAFDAVSELEEIKRKRKAFKQKRVKKSKLDKFETQLLKLHKSGASLGDLQFFLMKNSTEVALSTIHRFLKKHE